MGQTAGFAAGSWIVRQAASNCYVTIQEQRKNISAIFIKGPIELLVFQSDCSAYEETPYLGKLVEANLNCKW